MSVRPVIGITPDATEEKLLLARTYVAMVADAGGLAVILPPRAEDADAYLGLCDGFLLSGGDDPDMRRWGVPTHPKATPIDHERQAFECELLTRLDERPDIPVLGVCLGMQLMALNAGGTLDQHLFDSHPSADDHWGRRPHAVTGDLGDGTVQSHHRQAIVDAGALDVVARAHDGLIEAVRGPGRRFYLGVQWHPERTTDARLGIGIVRGLVRAAGG
ncbi:MAG: type 1 glutamine amidotransferase [Phycisphaerales bacterium]|nr:type 1 glutamine amidotransferase [Phycisphaerae bacterium]NNF43074.1 type 1 glutamine amidotransferase [Phycisphaerales bacterium]NNM24631.1 type 1 glutamine amidotransferase [Phycisphaerales bacterium]